MDVRVTGLNIINLSSVVVSCDLAWRTAGVIFRQIINFCKQSAKIPIKYQFNMNVLYPDNVIYSYHPSIAQSIGSDVSIGAQAASHTQVKINSNGLQLQGTDVENERLSLIQSNCSLLSHALRNVALAEKNKKNQHTNSPCSKSLNFGYSSVISVGLKRVSSIC